MVLARVATWKFKPDQRSKGFDVLKTSVGQLAHKAEGFRGSLVLLSHEDPNLGMVITFWNSDESEKIFADSMFELTTQNLKPFVTGPPEVTHNTVFSSELKQL